MENRSYTPESEQLNFSNNETNLNELLEQAQVEKSDMLKELGFKETLSESEINQVQDFAHEWLDAVLKMSGSLELQENAVMYIDQLLYQPLAEVVNEQEAVENRQLPQKFKLASKHFLTELVVILQSELQREDKKLVRDKIKQIHNVLFTYSPSIANFLNNRDLFILTTEVNRIPELQGWLGGNMAGELVYEWAYNFNNEYFKKFANDISEMPVDYALDSLSQIETIGANSLAQGDWAREAFHYVQNMLWQIENSDVSPLLKMQSRKIQERLTAQVNNPTNSVITFLGNKSDGRVSQKLDESALEQHKQLLRQIDCQNYDSVGYLIPVAKDAIGMFDHAGIPRQISIGGFEDLPEQKDISSIELTETILALQSREKISLKEILNLVNYVNLKFYPDMSQIDLVKIWSKNSNTLSERGWQRFLFSLDRATNTEQKYNNIQDELQNQAEEKNLKASKIFFDATYKMIPRLLETNELPSHIKDKLERLMASMNFNREQGLHELEFQDAEAIASQLRLLYSLQDGGLESLFGDRKDLNEQWSFTDPDIGKRFVATWEFLNKHHDTVWFNMKKKLNSYYHDFTKSGDVSISKDVWVLNRKSAEFKEDLINIFQKKKEEVSDGLAVRNFQNINSILDNELINPFKGTDSENLPLLLQSLYEPDLRKEIESKLHIDLSSMMLREQVHLLRFISQINSPGFDELANLFKDEALLDSDKKLISSAFFSCAANISYGEELLKNIKHHSEQNNFEVISPILKKYKEITDNIDSIELYCNKITDSNSSLETSEIISTKNIVQNIIKRANKLLIKSIGSNDIQEISKNMELVKTDLLIFGLVIRESVKSGEMLLSDFEDFESGVKSTSEFTDLEIDQIVELFIKNKSLDKNFDNEDSISAGVEELREDLSPESKAYFHTYKYKNELAAYIKVKPLSETEMYVGSFNADPEVRGSVPKILADEIIKTYGSQYDLVADAISGSPTERWYVQSYGFKPTGEVEEFGGISYSKLVRPRDLEKSFSQAA